MMYGFRGGAEGRADWAEQCASDSDETQKIGRQQGCGIIDKLICIL